MQHVSINFLYLPFNSVSIVARIDNSNSNIWAENIYLEFWKNNTNSFFSYDQIETNKGTLLYHAHCYPRALGVIEKLGD